MSETKEVPINLSMVENFTSRLLISTLKLFNAIPTKTQKKSIPSETISKEAIIRGFLFSPQVTGNYKDDELMGLVDTISNEIGLTSQQMNSTFNKSWKKVRDAPEMQLLAEQCYHYMTTYGYKEMGVYDENMIFIPNERLDVPLRGDGIKLTIINGYTKKQLKEKLIRLIESGIALDDINEIVEIAKWVEFTDDQIINMRNKEVRTKLYSHLNLIPQNPVELLRISVYETTGKTLLINNKKTSEMIKESGKGIDMVKLFEQYDEHFGYRKLAEIYNRFKPIFMSFKRLDGMPSIINRIGRLSKKYHRPITQDMLNNLTSMLKKGEPIYKSELVSKLDKANIWRKIRLAQSLNYRMNGNKSIVYKIRNGKSFATTMDFNSLEDTRKVYDIIMESITKDLKYLKGKEFYIPENIVYAIPTSTKQSSGNVPNGTYVRCGKDMIFGIWWKNVRGQTDLDLHGSSYKCGHIGWNTTQRSTNNTLLRTGDITDAPNGATELFYINHQYEDTILFNLNYYNFRENTPVPYKIMVADEHPDSFGRNYTINPNNIKCIIKSIIDVKQVTLGLGTVNEGECRFYFSESGLGDTNVVKGSEYINLARNYMSEFFKSQITFNEIVKNIGCKIVHEQTKNSIDLSPQNLQKDTFIKLLSNT